MKHKIRRAKKFPSAARILRVLEGLALIESHNGKDNDQFVSSVYRYTHIGSPTSCSETHSDWVADFYKVEKSLVDNKTIPPLRIRKKCSV
jgi:hypothetical protein